MAKTKGKKKGIMDSLGASHNFDGSVFKNKLKSLDKWFGHSSSTSMTLVSDDEKSLLSLDDTVDDTKDTAQKKAVHSGPLEEVLQPQAESHRDAVSEVAKGGATMLTQLPMDVFDMSPKSSKKKKTGKANPSFLRKSKASRKVKMTESMHESWSSGDFRKDASRTQARRLTRGALYGASSSRVLSKAATQGRQESARSLRCRDDIEILSDASESSISLSSLLAEKQPRSSKSLLSKERPARSLRCPDNIETLSDASESSISLSSLLAKKKPRSSRSILSKDRPRRSRSVVSERSSAKGRRHRSLSLKRDRGSVDGRRRGSRRSKSRLDTSRQQRRSQRNLLTEQQPSHPRRRRRSSMGNTLNNTWHGSDADIEPTMPRRQRSRSPDRSSQPPPTVGLSNASSLRSLGVTRRDRPVGLSKASSLRSLGLAKQDRSHDVSSKKSKSARDLLGGNFMEEQYEDEDKETHPGRRREYYGRGQSLRSVFGGVSSMPFALTGGNLQSTSNRRLTSGNRQSSHRMDDLVKDLRREKGMDVMRKYESSRTLQIDTKL